MTALTGRMAVSSTGQGRQRRVRELTYSSLTGSQGPSCRHRVQRAQARLPPSRRRCASLFTRFTLRQRADFWCCSLLSTPAAADYGNEKESGEGLARAIKDGIVTREEVFVTSKIWNTNHAYVSVHECSCELWM